MTKKHIAVLMGGWSAEREVSLSSGKGVARALEELEYKVTAIDVQRDIAEVLAKLKPDVAFNALHGQFGEDGCMQGVLEILQIPYTHSGVLASALAMDKFAARKIFVEAGLNVAEGRLCTKAELLAGDPLPRPYVVKPSNEGSSVGVKILMPPSLSHPGMNDNFFFTEENWPYSNEEILVERFIAGRELTVAVLDGTPLGVTEIKTHSGFYDYDNKYTAGRTDHICPAALPSTLYNTLMDMALIAHKALGCRGLTRSDFRYDDTAGGTGELVILETNTQPGMTPLSLSPEIASTAGISYTQLVEHLIKIATLGA